MRNIGLISILMAAYNAEKTIEISIKSVIAQTYKDWELIIIDDASTDSTLSIATRYASEDGRIHVFSAETNSGVSQTRKRALHEAHGEWIAILDSDDKWDERKLEKQIALQEKTDSPLLYTGSSFMDEYGNPLSWILHVPKSLTYRDLLKQNLLSNSSALVRRTLYENNYTFGDQMHEDYATWLKILKTGVIACGIDEPLLVYRLSSSSKTGNKWKSAQMNWNTYRHVGLHLIPAVYYMTWYTVKGLLKYRNLDSEVILPAKQNRGGYCGKVVYLPIAAVECCYSTNSNFVSASFVESEVAA